MPVSVAVSDLRISSGTHVLQWMCTATGRYTLDVAVGGQVIPGGPLEVKIAPASVSAFLSEVVVGSQSLETAAGETSTVAVFARDTYGNAMDASR